MSREEVVKFFSSNRKGICHVIFEYDGKMTKHSKLPCHAILLKIPNVNKLSAIWTSLLTGTSKAADAEAWWDYILNPRLSPWRSILKGREILKDEATGEYLAVRIPVDDNTQAQVTGSLCIATRQPNEFPRTVQSFRVLTKNKFTKPEALLLSAYYSITADEKMFIPNRLSGHGVFDVEKGISFKKLKKARPFADAELTLRGGSEYYGCMNLWFGNNKYKPPEPTAGQLMYNGIFAKFFKKTHRIEGSKLFFKTEKTFIKDQTIEHFKRTRKEWAVA